MDPVPGHPVTTAYGITGSMWSGCGFHTGVDIAAPRGATIVACIAGTIRHRDYGSAFGPYQFAISPSQGQAYADDEAFYAHCLSRLPDGTEVQAGDIVSTVGDLGNATGPHLHLEHHVAEKNSWDCGTFTDPTRTIIPHGGGQSATPPPMQDPYSYGDVYQAKLIPGENGNHGEGSDSVRRMQTTLNAWSFIGGQELPVTGYYGPDTQHEVGLFQEQVCLDPPDGAIGPKQTDVLLTKLGPWNIIR